MAGEVGAGVGKLRHVIFHPYRIWHGAAVVPHEIRKAMVGTFPPISRLEGVELKHVVNCKLEPAG